MPGIAEDGRHVVVVVVFVVIGMPAVLGQGLVDMAVRMMFGQMEGHPDRHEHRGCHQRPGQRIPKPRARAALKKGATEKYAPARAVPAPAGA